MTSLGPNMMSRVICWMRAQCSAMAAGLSPDWPTHRQPVVDRVVISHVNLGQVIGMKEGLLDEETRKAFGARVLERLETTETVAGKKYQIKSIIQMQARRLCLHLRGEKEYRPFTFQW